MSLFQHIDMCIKCDVSRWGVISYADSLDCLGVLGVDVAHVRMVFSTSSAFASKVNTHITPGTIAQYDGRDPSAATPATRQQAVEESSKTEWNKSSDLSGLRIGIPQVMKLTLNQ